MPARSRRPARSPRPVPLALALAVGALAAVPTACAGTEPDEAVVVPDGGPRTSTRPVVSPTIRLPRTTAPPRDLADGPYPKPAITEFTLSPMEPCYEGSATMTATYATTGADRVVFVVDDLQLPVQPPTSGSWPLQVDCDTLTHFVVLIAASPDDQTATERRTNVGHN